jgi:general secretion pathway protein D
LKGETQVVAGGKASVDAVSELTNRDIQKREASRLKAQTEIQRGEQWVALRQYENAIQCYVNALGLLPKAPLVEQERRVALKGFSDASLALVEVRISEGNVQSRTGQTVASAEDVLDNLLLLDPSNKTAKRYKEKLNTPGYYNPALTPEFRGDIERVKKFLLEGNALFESGRFDLAIKRADQVLDIDPYNSAARNLQERSNNAIKNAGESGYNESRSRALRDVQRAWSNPVKRYGNAQSTVSERGMVDPSQVEKLRLKLYKLTLPEIQFTEAPIAQVADTLTRAAQAADTGESNTGVLIIANFPASAVASAGAGPKTSIQDLAVPSGVDRSPGGVSVTTPKIPAGFTLREILDMVASLAEVKWVIKENRVEIVPKAMQTDTLVLRSWTVSPFLFSSTAPRVDDLSSMGAGSSLLAAGSGTGPQARQGGRRRIDPKEFLSGMNVRFDVPGATATFNSRNRILTVYNTVEMLDLVDVIVADSEGQSPVQVDIRTKFVEFTQTNLEELSFDWLLGKANVHGSSKVAMSGVGEPPSGKFPFTDASGNPVGGRSLTSGNRSGGVGIGVNAIDALLATPASGGAGSAALAIAGAFTDPQFQLLLHALNQRKDVDLLSSPSITARDQEEASIDIVREFRYPSEFTPPQIPQNIGATGTTGSAGVSTASIPVTPTTPTAFVPRETGVKLKVLPTIKGDNYAIDLELHPEVTEFEGFINYGSPIKTMARATVTLLTGELVAYPQSVVLTDNVINQPIFSVRKIQTTVTLLDGETIALGGLIREDVQKVNDKTPILGDIPLVGRLFRSKIDQHVKKNLTIFVTARIIDASGQPIKPSRSEIETEEVPSLLGGGSGGER